LMPAGGWYRDDLRLAIQYRVSGHADPVLKATIDIISQLPAADPLRQRLLKSPGVAACAACHAGATQSIGSWHSISMIGQRREFTKFRHRPHLNIASLSDCTECHQINHSRRQGSPTRISLTAAEKDPHDFAPMPRQTCAACHQRGAAGDGCIQCHRYHIDVR